MTENGWRDKEIERVRAEVTKLWASVTVLQQQVSTSAGQVDRNVRTLDRIERKVEKMSNSVTALDVKAGFWTVLGRGVTVLLALGTALMMYIVRD